MIGIEIPKMPPTVLIDDFTPIKKGVVPLNGRIDQSLIVIRLIYATRCKIADGLRVSIPFRRGSGLQSAVPPVHVGHGVVLPIKLQPDGMGLLLAALKFIDITILLREQANTQLVVIHLQGFRKVLPELGNSSRHTRFMVTYRKDGRGTFPLVDDAVIRSYTIALKRLHNLTMAVGVVGTAPVPPTARILIDL